MDKDLEDAMDRLSKNDFIEDQVNREIIRFWQQRVHQKDTAENRAFRKLIHKHVFEDSSS